MSYHWDADLTELRALVRDFVDKHGEESRVRELLEREHPYDDSTWDLMGQLGLASFTIPENLGGAGVGHEYLAIAMEELGRALLPSPLLTTASLAAGALLASKDAAALERLAPQLAAGQRTGTLAFCGPTGSWDPRTPPEVSARPAAETGWHLTGTAHHVLDGATADLLLVEANTDSGPSLFAVEAPAAGLVRQAMTTLDATRPQARLDLDEVPATLVGRPGSAAAVVERTLLGAATALAAEQVGAAQRCLDMAVSHARLRVQFGRPVGSYQAIKHRCADVHLEIECARAATYYAAAALTAGAPDSAAAVSIAASTSADALRTAAMEGIQIHGGTGFTWEHSAHLYFRRAVSTRHLFGSPAWHRDQVACQLLALEGSARPSYQREKAS